MFRFLTRVQFAYIGVLFAVCAGVFAYQAAFVWPAKACEAHGGWWSAKYNECATPMPIWRFTGRGPAGASAVPAPTAAVAPSKAAH